VSVDMTGFAKAAALGLNLQDTAERLLATYARDNGGPRDKRYRESVMTLAILLQQSAVKSELMPDAALNAMQTVVDTLIAGTRQTMVSEGIEIPGAACADRLMRYPDAQVGVMYAHGKTVPYDGVMPPGMEVAFIETVGDVQTFYLKWKTDPPITLEEAKAGL
jgi:hypothetical protein